MKFETTSVLALGLAGSATANWADWPSTSADPVKDQTTTTSTTTWEDWTTTSSTPAATTKTTTSSDPWEDWESTTSSTVKPTSKTTTSSDPWEDWESTTSSTVKPTSKTTTSSDPWEDWESTTSSTVKPTSKTTTTSDPWADWSSTAAPATKTVTVTQYAATTTVYKSTVFVGPGECTKTVFPSTCGGAASSSKPADASKASSSGPAAASSGWGAPAASSAPADATKGWGAPGASSAPAAASSNPAYGSWGSSPDAASSTKKTTTASTTTAADTEWHTWVADPTGPLDAGISSASIIATNSEVYTWTGNHDAKPTVSAAPTYAGWGDWSGGAGNGTGSTNGTGSGVNGTGPALGSDASNLTKPFEPLAETGCNSASDRSKWCGKFSIDTDYYQEAPSTGKVCSANWVITNTTKNYDGIDRLALAVNDQVPGPLLECNWGDTVQVTITNKLTDNSTTIHWHGIIQKGTNDQDGVPGVTECAVAPGESRTYTFKANQYGTGWYHSHVLTQYGDGIRGPMVIHGPATANYDVDAGTVMIDDLFGTPAAPMTVAETNARIAHFGPGGTWNYMLNGANTFPDLSKGKHALWQVKSGKKYLFRLINSASQNMWSVHFDNHKMTVISADWVPITPYTTEWVNIGIGQRYDVIVEMNQPTAGYFLRAVAQTGCPSGGANDGLGKANGIFAYEGADLTLPTTTAGGKTAADFNICADEPLASIVPHVKKSGGSRQLFDASSQTIPAGLVATVNTADDGAVFRWFINNGAMNVNFTQPTLQDIATGVSNTTYANYITLTAKNQWVYFVIQNQFFASHPMHLHGHDMSVLGQGNVAWNPSLASTLNFDNPARRDTAMLAGSAGPGSPPGYTVIGFETDNPGAWLMHCHIIWHVDGGLALQWIERPSEITTGSYVNSAFKNECSTLSKYEAFSPSHIHSTGSSGLKARYAEEMIHSGDVVRRSAEKSYLDSYNKRAVGDGFRARHGARL